MTNRFASGILGLGCWLGLGACDLADKSLTDGGAVDGSEEAGGEEGSATTGGGEGTSTSADPSSATSTESGATDPGTAETSRGSDTSTTSGGNPGSEEGGPLCSEAGCTDGLFVHVALDEVRGGGYSLDVYVAPAVDVWTGCSVTVLEGRTIGEPSCSAVVGDDGLWFLLPVIEAPEVRIDVSWNDHPIASTTFEPVYEIVMPNGPECPPVCREASITVEGSWPALAACDVDGAVYAHGESFADPFSCNTCTCDDGDFGACTEAHCPEPCPEPLVPGRECAQCGPTDACEVWRIACFPACMDERDCGDGSFCDEGVCVSLCG